ncbi:hypothetical protein ONE63_001250 [Megalurothrips usitatus]|uniref:DDB1- and CUL4-associated factor 11 n=1 Tax=Megalurothrips usitatus TaxID=439358 RepID=A0AAV7XBH2_9NEOP|nr:hypothetical protein ONE63_001250 [Megalurothrips usitatus]
MGATNTHSSMDEGDGQTSQSAGFRTIQRLSQRLRNWQEGYDHGRNATAAATASSMSDAGAGSSGSGSGSGPAANVQIVVRPRDNAIVNVRVWEVEYVDEEVEGSSTRQDSSNKGPNTKELEESEFCLMTKMACGLKPDSNSQYEKPSSVLKLISQREIGTRGGGGFTSHDISNTIHHFLPNKMTVEDQYFHKAFCGTYSTDGDYFLSACQDRMLRLYKTTGKRFRLLRTIAARDVGWSILDTAFSPDGSCCAYSSWSDSIYVVRLFGDSDSHDALMLSPTQSRFCIFSLVFSQDGQEILCGANDGFMYLYDRYSNQRILRIPAHYTDVNTVAYADNTSHILYSGSDDGLCKVWDRRTLSESDPQPVGVLAGHQDGITFIEPRGDGRHFLSNSKDQTIKLWDVRKFSSEDAQEETRQHVASQNWDYRWQKVPHKFREATLASLKGDSSVMTYRGHSVLQTLVRCHFSPTVSTGQRYIYSGCAEGRVFIYDALTGHPVKVLRGHRACVRDVSWHPYKTEIASTSVCMVHAILVTILPDDLKSCVYSTVGLCSGTMVSPRGV